MQTIHGKLTVFFEVPFWVGVYELVSDGKLEVCKITFGTEPKDYEVYEFLLQNWEKLRFSPPVLYASMKEEKRNPKRMQRAIQKQVEKTGIGTKAQQAFTLAQEENRKARKEKKREKKEEEKERKFLLRQQKRKEKHRGK